MNKLNQLWQITLQSFTERAFVFVCIGIGAFGVGLLGLKALLMLAWFNDPAYLVIWIFGIVLAAFALYHPIKYLLTTDKESTNA